MARFALVVLVVLALAGTATAAAPEGFRSSWPLAKRAEKISGQPATKVYCANSWASWDEFAFANVQRNDIEGLTNIATREIALAPDVCRPLERHLRGTRVKNEVLGPAIQTLTHESLHASGISDEMDAECGALHIFKAVAYERFGIKSPTRRAELLAQARKGSFCNRR